MKVLLTGATGFLGRHTKPVLDARYGSSNVIGVSKRDYNLLDARQVELMFSEVRPDVVVHLAAYSGGIGANRTYPADFYFRNTVLTALAFDAASRFKVKKFVYTMGGCSYPATATSPIDESQLWQGYPQKESAAYSTAKMMGTVAARAYREQYGLNAVVIIPGNLYGEFDNYSTLDSHVVPAFIRRYHEATLRQDPEVLMWGSGMPQRDFVYAGDVAQLIPYFIDTYNSPEPVNISCGVSTSIRDLAEQVKTLTGYSGCVRWDTSKPDGQMTKVFSTDRLRSLGLSCDTPLHDGLSRTIAWFQRNYAARGDGIRL